MPRVTLGPDTYEERMGIDAMCFVDQPFVLPGYGNRQEEAMHLCSPIGNHAVI